MTRCQIQIFKPTRVTGKLTYKGLKKLTRNQIKKRVEHYVLLGSFFSNGRFKCISVTVNGSNFEKHRINLILFSTTRCDLFFQVIRTGKLQYFSTGIDIYLISELPEHEFLDENVVITGCIYI